MRVLHVDCGLRVGVRLAVAAVTAACLVNGGCAASKFPPITIPANAKVLCEYLSPDAARPPVPTDSSGRYYVYDETDDELTHVFFVAPQTPVNLNCLPGGHRYRVYYIPRQAGAVTAQTMPEREAHGVGTEVLLQQARQATEKLNWLDPGGVIYNREFYRFGPVDAPENWQTLQQLTRMPYTIGDAAPLLKDPDPKVRTLGIVMLYYKGGAPAVNEIVALVDDDAETYPQPAFGGVTIRDPWPMIKQKVKDLATQIVQRHLTITNTGGISGHTLKDAWRRYWSIRKDRPYATADFVTALDRAAGGTSPIRPERMPAIQRVADNVRQLPMPDRFFIMHAMWFHMGGRFPDTRQTPVVSRDELVAMARELPVETRWMMAHGRIATDDPDLPKWTNDDLYRDARRVVRSVN